MLEGLRYALEQTGFAWAFAGWSEAPKTDYGVYSLSGQVQFRGDGDSGSEIMLRGYVDYFTHDRTRAPQKAIENALRSIGLWWNLESIQFEPETGFIHYEWGWADTEGKADMCVIKFVTHEGETVHWIKPGETPQAPDTASWYQTATGVNSGTWNCPYEWDHAVAPAYENSVYTMVYFLGMSLVEEADGWKVYNFPEDAVLNENGFPTGTCPLKNRAINRIILALSDDKPVYSVDATGAGAKLVEVYGLTFVFERDEVRITAEVVNG